MKIQQDPNLFGKPKLTIGQKSERAIVYAIMWIAFYNICEFLYPGFGNWNILAAALWSANILGMKDFSKWMSNK